MLGVIRYADDFIVTARDKESLEFIQIQIQQWLSERGLELSSEKTLITSMEDGFDFLGFNHRHYNGKLLIKPTKKKVLDFCKRLGREIKGMNGCEQVVVIKKLNPILRGFANWSERKSKLYDGSTSKAIKKQDRKCVACGLTFIGEEKIHLHHVDGNHDNWEKKNLVAIHESCHDYIHMDRRGKVVAIHDLVSH